jgi:hypothetical protein
MLQQNVVSLLTLRSRRTFEQKGYVTTEVMAEEATEYVHMTFQLILYSGVFYYTKRIRFTSTLCSPPSLQHRMNKMFIFTYETPRIIEHPKLTTHFQEGFYLM